MAITAVSGASLILGAFDVSPFTGSITDTPGEVKTLPYTTFALKGYQGNAASIRHGAFGFDGYGDYTATTGISSVLNATTVGTQYAFIASLGGETVGDPAVIGRGIVSNISQGSPVGELPTLKVGIACDTTYATRAYLAAPLASRTTSGLTGTAVAMTGPSASQLAYAALCVTAASGTNLVVKVQSDDNSSFTSATDRITFSTVSATGWQYSSVAGDLSTETHWRVVATIASGTFSFACAIGVA